MKQEHVFILLTAVPCSPHFRFTSFLSLPSYTSLIPMSTHFQSPLEFWPHRISDHSSATKDVWTSDRPDRTHLQIAWRRRNHTRVFTTFLFISRLAPVFSQLISPFLGEHLFRHPQLCLREGCSNHLLPTARINMRFIPQNIFSNTSAEGWPVSFFRSRATFPAV